MPIYEYHCCDCVTTFEAPVRSGDTVTCPHCGSSSLAKLLSAPFISSGQDVPAAVGKNGLTRCLAPKGTCVDVNDEGR